MKKNTHYIQSLLCAMALFASVDATAQNTFPANGAVGLGTINPMPNFGSGIGLHIDRPAFNGGEMFLNCTVQDAPDFMRLTNASGGPNEFIPMLLGNKGLRAVGGSSRQALLLTGNIDGSHDFAGNTSPVMTFRASTGYIANQAPFQAIVNRPLFSWDNAGAIQMTMLANGFLGIGTTTPTEQLHTTAGVRFQGLPFQANLPFVVGMDNTGRLFRTNVTATPPVPGITNACSISDYITKSNSLGNLVCSQIFDNGTNIGIGTATPVSQLHTTAGVRFAGLPVYDPKSGNKFPRYFTVSNKFGDLQFMDINTMAQLDCKTPNFITKTDGLGKLTCSQLFDDSKGVGIGTTQPTSQFHTTLGVRFQGLPIINPDSQQPRYFVVSDSLGNLSFNDINVIGGVSGVQSDCTTPNYIPKTSALGKLSCSQLFDDGASVGIGTTSFAYNGGAIFSTGNIPSSGTAKLAVDGVVMATGYVATSDANYKKNIVDIKDAKDKVLMLRGVSYDWKSGTDKNLDNLKQLGFIAQEVEKVLPEAVVIDKNGKYGINYNMLMPVIVEAIKIQNKEIESLKAQVANLVGENKANISISTEVSELYQNQPNPFRESTVIKFKIAKNANSKMLVVYDMQGKQLRKIEILGDAQQVVFEANSLSAGMYLYALIVNGKEVDTKRMIIMD